MAIIVDVMRHADGSDCTRGGISSKHTQLLVVNVEGPLDPEPKDLEHLPPAVLLEEHYPGCLRLVPARLLQGAWQRVRKGWMFGGNFAYTSDSRFSEACQRLLKFRFYGAVAVHDRTEED